MLDFKKRHSPAVAGLGNPAKLTFIFKCDKICLIGKLIERGGGTGPVKPRQPRLTVEGAKSGRTLEWDALEDEVKLPLGIERLSNLRGGCV